MSFESQRLGGFREDDSGSTPLRKEPREPLPDFQQALSNLSNPELLSALDLALLELEKRLFRYAKVGPELLEMADEGLVPAARAKARLGQSL
jgi:hypothetical protein